MNRESEDKIHCDTSTSNGGDDKSDEGTHPRNLRSQLNTEPTTGQSQLLETDAGVLKTDSGQDESADAISSGLKNQQSQTAQCSTSQNTSTLASENLGKSDSQSLSGDGKTGGVGGVDYIPGGGETNNAVNSGLNAADSLRHKTTPTGGNDNTNTPSGNTIEPPQIEVAVEYVTDMKMNQPEIYKNYLNIMHRYKNGEICTGQTILSLCNIFRKHINLIRGFNMFLPPGYKIVIQSTESGISKVVVSIPTGCFGTYINVNRPIPNLRSHQYQAAQYGTAYNTSFIAIGNLGASGFETLSAGVGTGGGVVGAAPAIGGGGIPIYVIDFNPNAANSGRHKTPATYKLKTQEAVKYLKEVEYRYSDHPQTCNAFLDILRRFKSRRLDLPDTVQRLCYLFKDNIVLIYNFNIFLEPGHGIEILSNQGISVAVLWMKSPLGSNDLCVKTYKIPNNTSEAIPTNLNNTLSILQQQSAADPIILQLQNGSLNRKRSISLSKSIARPSTSSPINDLNSQGYNLQQISQAIQLINQSETVEHQNQSVEFNHELSDNK